MIKLVYRLDGARKARTSASHYELVAECIQSVAYRPRFNDFPLRQQSHPESGGEKNEVCF